MKKPNALVKLFRRLLGVSSPNELEPDVLMSTVIYNTDTRVIILINYGSYYFYDMIEFLSKARECSIDVLIANKSIESKLDEKEEDDFDKKQITFEDNKYYAVISGSPVAYKQLYSTIDLANPILMEITKDIYEYCDSTIFNTLTNAGVLQKSRFKNTVMVPKYDSKAEVSYINISSGNRESIMYDDIAYISPKIPNIFSRVDVLSILYVYTKYGSISLRKLPELYGNDEPLIYNALKDDVYGSISSNTDRDFMAEFLSRPIYERPETDDDYEEDEPLPLDEMDDIFKPDYERFTATTADAMGLFVSLDEAISSEPKTDSVDE